jgi:proteasome component ECM29
MAVGKPAIAHKVTEFFFELSSMTTKNMELCFSIGESMCAIAYGFEATNMEIFLDLEDAPKIRQSTSQADAALLLTKVLDWTKPGQSPVNRKNAVIWLLCMVKYIGRSTAIQQSLVQIHSAFSSLLGDRDDLIQDVASKGIGLLYDLGDDTMRERLIGSLVTVLSEGRKVAAQSVTNDTVLFDESALGSTPTGESISTYQSVLSLAADLNQPDLVYRFMSLASHNAIWNSKKGASLGFSSIAAKAKHELAPHLTKIIPKLYRYQFDPNHHIAENMKNIWLTLVSEPAKSVNDNFDSIMKELLACIVDRQWRSREASCSAIADLIHGRQLAELESYLQELWSLCFRALDDIKESVRVAAFSTCKALTNFTLKYSDSDNASSKDSAKVLSVVVPFFLTKGIGSMSEDVRNFSLKTLLKICDKGGPLLKAHATEIMMTLLEGLSSLEPQVMSKNNPFSLGISTQFMA